jgi:hypothetical protein
MKRYQEQIAEWDARRKAAGVSDREVYEKTGIREASISKYRTGSLVPGMKQWERLSDGLEGIIAEKLENLRRLTA